MKRQLTSRGGGHYEVGLGFGVPRLTLTPIGRIQHWIHEPWPKKR